jgi:hypothetical protein
MRTYSLSAGNGLGHDDGGPGRTTVRAGRLGTFLSALAVCAACLPESVLTRYPGSSVEATTFCLPTVVGAVSFRCTTPVALPRPKFHSTRSPRRSSFEVFLLFPVMKRTIYDKWETLTTRACRKSRDLVSILRPEPEEAGTSGPAAVGKGGPEVPQLAATHVGWVTAQRPCPHVAELQHSTARRRPGGMVAAGKSLDVVDPLHRGSAVSTDQNLCGPRPPQSAAAGRPAQQKSLSPRP